jgi:hypothetical protein
MPCDFTPYSFKLSLFKNLSMGLMQFLFDHISGIVLANSDHLSIIRNGQKINVIISVMDWKVKRYIVKEEIVAKTST